MLYWAREEALAKFAWGSVQGNVVIVMNLGRSTLIKQRKLCPAPIHLRVHAYPGRYGRYSVLVDDK